MDLFRWLKNVYRENYRPEVRLPEGPHTPPIRRRCRFFGLVQFVGFRYEAKLVAGQLGLVGWAQNQSDGTVVIEIEGEAGCIEEFLRVMQTVPRFDITDIQAEELPLRGTERDFQVIMTDGGRED